MDLGDFKEGAEMMVKVVNAPIPNVTLLVGFTSKVKTITRVDYTHVAIQFENGVLVEASEEDFKAGRITGELG